MWNTELISAISVGAAATVPIIVALTQIVKMTGWVQDKYAPFVSIGFGILIAWLFAANKGDFSANVLSGIMFGLAASGLYSGLQASSEEKKKKKREAIMKKDKLRK